MLPITLLATLIWLVRTHNISACNYRADTHLNANISQGLKEPVQNIQNKLRFWTFQACILIEAQLFLDVFTFVGM